MVSKIPFHRSFGNAVKDSLGIAYKTCIHSMLAALFTLVAIQCAVVVLPESKIVVLLRVVNEN